MQTIEIKEFRTVCKGSRLIAVELLKNAGAKIARVAIVNPKYIGKTIIYYNAENKQLANLNVHNYGKEKKLLLVVPTYSPIYSED